MDGALTTNLIFAVIAAVVAGGGLFARASFFGLGIVLGPMAILLAIGFKLLFGGAGAKTGEAGAPRRKDSAEQARLRGLLEQMRSKEAAQKRIGSEDTAKRLVGGIVKALGGEKDREVLNRPPASGKRGGAELTREERAARRTSDAEARSRSRRESHERRHAKMPSSGLSPDDPEFLRGYRPKTNRIP